MMLASLLLLSIFATGEGVVVVARRPAVVVARPVVYGRKLMDEPCKSALEVRLSAASLAPLDPHSPARPQVLQADPDFSKLLSLAPELLPPVPTLLQSKLLSYTFFAPTNAAVEAFVSSLGSNASSGAWPAARISQRPLILSPSLPLLAVLSNKTIVTKLIEYHVVPGVKAISTRLVNGSVVPTVLGATRTLTIELMAQSAGAQHHRR